MSIKTVLCSIVVLLFFCSCGLDTPSISDIKKALEPQLTRYGQIIDLKKTNGEKLKNEDVDAYRLYYRVSVKLNDRCYWREFFTFHKLTSAHISNDSKGIANPKYDANYATAKKIPKGSTYITEGNVIFKKTEKGWLNVRTNKSREGYCNPNTTPEACAQKLGFASE